MSVAHPMLLTLWFGCIGSAADSSLINGYAMVQK